MKVTFKRFTALFLSMILTMVVLAPSTALYAQEADSDVYYETTHEAGYPENENIATPELEEENAILEVEVESTFFDIEEETVVEEELEVQAGVIEVTMTSAIDGSPFIAHFDPATGLISMYSTDGESIGQRYVGSEEAFWELVAVNTEVTSMPIESRMELGRSVRDVSDSARGTMIVEVFEEEQITSRFDTGIRLTSVPRGNRPGDSTSLVGGGYFPTNSSHRSVSLQSYNFPTGMSTMDVLITNQIGDCVGSLWDMPPQAIATHTMRFPGEPYGALVSSFQGSFSSVQLRLFADNGNTTPPVNNVTITYSGNGGTVSPSSASLTPGQPFGTMPTPTRSGWTFVGWFNTSASTGGTQFTPASNVPASNTTLWARWSQPITGSRTLTHTGSMMITGWAGQNLTSNAITFNGSVIPSGARVTSISISTGTSTMSGAIMGNNLQISSTSRPGYTLSIPWNGANNSVLNDTHSFWNHDARATYTIRWNGAVISNTPGNLLNPGGTQAIRGYSNVKLTINYMIP